MTTRERIVCLECECGEILEVSRGSAGSNVTCHSCHGVTLVPDLACLKSYSIRSSESRCDPSFHLTMKGLLYSFVPVSYLGFLYTLDPVILFVTAYVGTVAVVFPAIFLLVIAGGQKLVSITLKKFNGPVA